MKISDYTSSFWVQEVKKLKNFDSDTDLAIWLNVKPQEIYNWKNNISQLKGIPVIRIGFALDVNPLFIICCSEWHIAKSALKKKSIEKIILTIDPKHPLFNK